VTAVRLRTVDAFTESPFTGNPAAVLVLDEAPSDEWMAAVARETNLSDTGFVIREELPDADFRLRWFTPTVEINLCGHATLASAHCLFEDGLGGPIRFATPSGLLAVEQRPDGSLAMDFPAWPVTQFEARTAVAETLGVPVEWTGRTDNGAFLLALVADEGSVRNLSPDLAGVSTLDASVGLIPDRRGRSRTPVRLRLPRLRPAGRDPRGSRNRQRTHRAGALLGRQARTDIARRPPSVPPVRACRR
jgi:PhzF family phenazine biosynthesis protein